MVYPGLHPERQERITMNNISIRIKDRREDEKPYEKCLNYGPQVLTDVELLAVILRSGTKDMDVLTLSSVLLNGDRAHEGISSILHYTYEELTDIKGIGPVKAIQIMCVGELVQRIWKSSISGNMVTLKTPEACAGYFAQSMRYLEKEELKVAYLDNRNRLIYDCVMTKGTCDSSLVSVRDILEAAFKHHASRILLIHNHPYTVALPSDDDHEVTRQVSAGAKAVGMRLIDHIIIGDNNYYSFKEKGFID